QGVFRGFLGPRTRHPVESQEGLHELLPREPTVERVVLRTIAEASLHRDVVPRILAEEPQGPLVRMQLADEEFEQRALASAVRTNRKSTRLNSSHVSISYAVFCLKKKST